MSEGHTFIAIAVILAGISFVLAGVPHLVRLFFWVWGQTYRALADIGYRVAKLLNDLLAPNPRNGRVKPGRIVALGLASLALLGAVASLDASLLKVLMSSALVILLALQFVAHSVLMAEQAQLLRGTLRRQKTRMRGLEGAFPSSLQPHWAICLVLALSCLFAGLDGLLPGEFLEPHGSVQASDWILLVLTIAFTDGLPEALGLKSALILAPGYGYALDTLVWILLGVLLYSNLHTRFLQEREINYLIQGLRSDQADIGLLQRRVARLPSRVKEKILKLALHDPEPLVRKRAIGAMYHARIVSFPQVLVYHLHREREETIKLIGLREALRLIDDPELHLDAQRQRAIDRALRYQLRYKRRFHSPEVLVLLDQLGLHPKLRPLTVRPDAGIEIKQNLKTPTRPANG